jgi:DNA-binding HxlR family transcriptional regulator
MGEQIRPVLVEKVDRYFIERRARGTIERQAQERCRNDLIAFLNEAIRVFQRDGKEDLARYLDENEERVTGPSSSCSKPDRSKFATEMVGQLRSYLDTFEFVSRPIVPVAPAAPPIALAERSLSPTRAEEMLAPLSNSWRINILMLLSEESASLAELSKALGLKKGHLQFHLKTLVGPKYIAYDRRTHQYSITSKGSTALNGLASLIEDLTTA